MRKNFQWIKTTYWYRLLQEYDDERAQVLNSIIIICTLLLR